MSQPDNDSLLKEVVAQYQYASTADHPLPPGKISFEEFLDWTDEDTLAEWVEGEVVLMTPASLKHQTVVVRLLEEAGSYIRSKGLGMMIPAPFLVRLPEPLKRAREPDLIFIARERLHLLKPTYLDGAPDLVVEITSPESLNRDRHVKFAEYEQAGVREYWLIHPDIRQAEFFQLQEGSYRQIRPGEDGVYHSQVLPGFKLNLKRIWGDI